MILTSCQDSYIAGIDGTEDDTVKCYVLMSYRSLASVFLSMIVLSAKYLLIAHLTDLHSRIVRANQGLIYLLPR